MDERPVGVGVHDLPEDPGGGVQPAEVEQDVVGHGQAGAVVVAGFGVPQYLSSRAGVAVEQVAAAAACW